MALMRFGGAGIWRAEFAAAECKEGTRDDGESFILFAVIVVAVLAFAHESAHSCARQQAPAAAIAERSNFVRGEEGELDAIGGKGRADELLGFKMTASFCEMFAGSPDGAIGE